MFLSTWAEEGNCVTCNYRDTLLAYRYDGSGSAGVVASPLPAHSFGTGKLRSFLSPAN